MSVFERPGGTRLTLSARQYRVLEAMGIDVWVPRAKPQPVLSAKPAPGNAPEAAPPEEATSQTVQQMPSKAEHEVGPTPRLSALSLKSGGHHALIDDSTLQERAFWVDLLRSSHGFDARVTVREGRFDWPVAGLPETDEASARKALLGYVQADALIWVRGDALANVLFGAGQWRSFPERHALGQAEAWVLGSDFDLTDAKIRRALWVALEENLCK